MSRRRRPATSSIANCSASPRPCARRDWPPESSTPGCRADSPESPAARSSSTSRDHGLPYATAWRLLILSPHISSVSYPAWRSNNFQFPLEERYVPLGCGLAWQCVELLSRCEQQVIPECDLRHTGRHL